MGLLQKNNSKNKNQNLLIDNYRIYNLTKILNKKSANTNVLDFLFKNKITSSQQQTQQS